MFFSQINLNERYCKIKKKNVKKNKKLKKRQKIITNKNCVLYCINDILAYVLFKTQGLVVENEKVFLNLKKFF